MDKTRTADENYHHIASAAHRVRRRMCIAAALAIAATGSACSLIRPKAPAPSLPPAPPAPPPPPPPKLSIHIDAAHLINPDVHGRSSPVVLRLYELTSLVAFEAADFMSLYSQDRATLGGELVEREELMLEPGELKVIDKLLAPPVRAFGVVAGFRDVQNAMWRSSQALIRGKDNVIDVRVDGLRVSLHKAAR